MRREYARRGNNHSASSSASRNYGGAGPSRRQHTTRSEIYDDLLEEALRQSPRADNDRPLKKRKSRRDPSEVIVIEDSTSGMEDVVPKEKRREVVVIESSREATEDEDEDNVEWDNVDLNAMPTSDDIEEPETAPEVREVTLNSTPQKSQKKSLGTPRTSVLRHIRLEAHKMYLLSLLASFRNLNHLLSSPSLLKLLRPYLAPATINALNAGPEHTQARRTISFLSGLRDVVQSWSERWKETRRGWRRPRWVDSEDLGKIPSYLDLNATVSLETLSEAARTRSGSRDVGAWLFTALLRSAGVETRLGSRQQFLSDTREQTTQSKLSPGDLDVEVLETRSARNPSFPSSSIRQTGFYDNPAQYIAQTKTFSPHHPYFWSEAWDVASQKWICVEAMISARVNQPSKIEPPNTAAAWETGAMGDNTLSYAIGFDNSGFAKDVTRRYAKAYYAKTWKSRIESQPGGENWYTKIIKYLDRMEPLDRDQLEEIDLANHLLKEPMPKKIDDFRHHPLYVLERHLRRNEMLRPGAVHVGALTSGKGMNLRTENVYKRKDIIYCYSAREWFRKGRIIKEKVQPIKYTSTSSRRRATSRDEDEDEQSEDPAATALYSELQTELYIPPPVENGIVPKNIYGNIDVYTPPMVPAGGAHIIRPSIAHAAHFAGIDYAEAVTGFDFVRNKANARVNGIVVAQENVEGLLSVWEGMMERVMDEEERLRVKGIMERWRKFFLGMQIKGRLDATHGKIEGFDEAMDEGEESERGGFFQEGGRHVGDFEPGFPMESGYPRTSELGEIPENISRATYMSSSNDKIGFDDTVTTNVDEARLEDPDQYEENPGLPKGAEMKQPKFDDEMSGGGFIPEDESEGGGFLPEFTNEESDHSDEFIYEDEDGIL